VNEKHYRSVVKALSWRVTGTLDTILLSFIVTGKIKMALSIGVAELFTKIGLYYAHERAWNRMSFGREKSGREYEI
jgi:uncharacterized membrane protein